jgi:hypothetical protein
MSIVLADDHEVVRAGRRLLPPRARIQQKTQKGSRAQPSA